MLQAIRCVSDAACSIEGRVMPACFCICDAAHHAAADPAGTIISNQGLAAHPVLQHP